MRRPQQHTTLAQSLLDDVSDLVGRPLAFAERRPPSWTVTSG
jgi:hypothetical protein